MASSVLSRTMGVCGTSVSVGADLRGSGSTAATSSFSGQKVLPSTFSRNALSHGRSRNAQPIRALKANEVDVNKVQPMGDRLFVRVDDTPEASAGGVLLPKSATGSEKFLLGEVLAVGKEAGEKYSKGQRVLFTDLHTQEVSLGSRKDKLAFVKAKDLLGVVE